MRHAVFGLLAAIAASPVFAAGPAPTPVPEIGAAGSVGAAAAVVALATYLWERSRR